jgi:ATP-dependent DNA helicase RecQ
MGSALRILEKHGMLSRDDERIAAARPEPGVFAPLDVASLQRRAEVERGKLRTMIEYAYYPRCRRQFVLEYFGDQDWASRDRQCGACDNCEAIAQGRTTGLSDTEQQAIRSLLGLVGTLHGRYGRKRVAAIALGDDLDGKLEDLPERGCIRGWPEKQVMDLLRSLEGAGLIEASRGEYPTIATTRRGDQVAVGRLDPNELGIQMPTVTSTRSKKRAGGGKPWFLKRKG